MDKARKTIEVDFMEWHRLRLAVEAMQAHTFYCEDDQGALRRWHPPRIKHKEQSDG